MISIELDHIREVEYLKEKLNGNVIFCVPMSGSEDVYSFDGKEAKLIGKKCVFYDLYDSKMDIIAIRKTL